MLFKSKETRQKVTLVAGLLFAIGMGQSLIASFLASGSIAENTAQAVDAPAAETVDLAKGYEIVLEREPNNQTALRGLVEAQIASENWDQVIAPLEKLIALNPEDESYPVLMATVKEQIARQNTTSTESSSPTP